MPLKKKKLIRNKKKESAISSSTISQQIAYGQNISNLEINTLKSLHDNLSESPRLPDHLAPNYEQITSHKHTLIAYDPVASIATNMDTGKTKHYKTSDPITFILSDQSMPGALKPAAARQSRYQDDINRDDILEDANGNKYVICPSHGDVIKVESLQTDHADSASAILNRQIQMIKELNNNKDIANIFIKHFNLDDLFVLINGNYQGTLYFYERYYNDIRNLWNICHTCNLHKNDKDPLDWFKRNEMFGPAFITHLTHLGIKEGLITTVNGKGLAEFAIEWYHEKHKELIDTTKRLYKDIIFKIRNNLQKAAKAVASGNDEKANAYNAQASLTTALSVMSSNVNLRIQVTCTTPPISPENSQSTSDEDREMLVASSEECKRISNNILDGQNPVFKQAHRMLKDNLREQVRQEPSTDTEKIKLFNHYNTRAKQHQNISQEYQKKAEKYKPQLSNSSVLPNDILHGNKRKASSDLEDKSSTPDQKVNMRTFSTSSIFKSLRSSNLQPQKSTKRKNMSDSQSMSPLEDNKTTSHPSSNDNNSDSRTKTVVFK